MTDILSTSDEVVAAGPDAGSPPEASISIEPGSPRRSWLRPLLIAVVLTVASIAVTGGVLVASASAGPVAACGGG
jgi:hypothetical protein